MIEWGFIYSNIVNLAINLLYTLISLFIGVVALKVVDRHILKSVDLEEEIKKGNIAAAILAATILIFVAIIVAFGLKS